MSPFFHFARPSRRTKAARGFTVIEILVVVAVIAILGAVAVVGYNRYVAKSQSSELALKYDAVRTNVAVAHKAGHVQEQCSVVVGNVNPANLRSDYAAMDVAFEAVPGGFTPAMRFCATTSTHGSRGVEVAREAHTLLSRSAAVGKGAVIGETAVSFSVCLADGAVLCKVAPPAAMGGGACNFGTTALAANSATGASGGGVGGGFGSSERCVVHRRRGYLTTGTSIGGSQTRTYGGIRQDRFFPASNHRNLWIC